jgi:hypothetical protein
MEYGTTRLTPRAFLHRRLTTFCELKKRGFYKEESRLSSKNRSKQRQRDSLHNVQRNYISTVYRNRTTKEDLGLPVCLELLLFK